MDSMNKYYNMSMVDVAYELMSKKKSAVNFYKLWEEVCQMKKFDDVQKDDKESLFYTNITLDGRFITVGENNWDLRSRHKFSDVHIDMNDIYAYFPTHYSSYFIINQINITSCMFTII